MAGRVLSQRSGVASCTMAARRALPCASLRSSFAASCVPLKPIVGQGVRNYRVAIKATAAPADAPSAAPPATGSAVKVRFAPSPTGNLHVGGARTALFNWLYAKSQGGKMVLRVEDTDAERSTRESEEAVIRDLKWMGLTWDEGPDVGGENGPYRQSERKEIYMKYVNELFEKGQCYPCFCSDEELQAMREEAEEKKLPPIYRGKWATASEEEVKEAMDAGIPYCYRFRVPKGQDVTIEDAVRGSVTWNTDTLGDFVIMRSNGLPVYNFCVAIDDALMGITHVLRAEEHLTNTLKQVLIYNELGFDTPTFGHMSLILAPDKSKLSKRHGATSVGEFKEEGYLPAAMLNYLSLLGWNDGTEQEIYTSEELQSIFNTERITKSGAVFDKTKLNWMNGQHLRALPEDELTELVGAQWVSSKILAKPDSPFVREALKILQSNMELVKDADGLLEELFVYPLEETFASGKADKVLEDDFKQVADAVLAAWDSGELKTAIAEGGFKKFIKAVGKEQERKGKRLFMPMRIAMTGRMQGPDVGEVLSLLALDDSDIVSDKYVALEARMEALRSWSAAQ